VSDREPTPPLEYRNPMHMRQPRWFRLMIGWTAGVMFVVLLLISCLLPSLGRARESANRVKCASNLRQLGTAVQLYANENRGQLPPDWPALLTTQDLVPECFICPSRDLDRATGPNLQAVVASMLSGEHLGYVWTGHGLQQRDLTATTVLAFDFENHMPKDAARNTGMNVLFGDGSVEFVDESTAKAIWAQFIAGVRPILRPTTATPGATSTPVTAR
jgi:prepilin-type processing-associated H-X9-DG protein